MTPQRPRLWIKLAESVAQKPADSYRGVTHRAGECVEISGYVRYPGEKNPYSAPETEWSFWGSHDIDLSPIFKENPVKKAYVESGHPYAAKLRDAADAGASFTMTIAKGPSGGKVAS